jgi:hypothetical protein
VHPEHGRTSECPFWTNKLALLIITYSDALSACHGGTPTPPPSPPPPTSLALGRYGFGLPLAQLNVRQFLGGGLAIHSTPGRGTAVEITLCPTGDAAAF